MTSRPTRGGGATRYELSGPNTHLSVATDAAGEVVVTYQYKDRRQAYAGPHVQILETEAGRLMTVALDAVASAGSTLTVLVPHVGAAAGETPVETEAVRALATAGVAPLPGRSGMYQVVKLRGTAR